MANDEREPPSSGGDDGSDTPTERCEYCGKAVETGEWYPVTKERDADGSLRLYSFCSEECQEKWREERSE